MLGDTSQSTSLRVLIVAIRRGICTPPAPRTPHLQSALIEKAQVTIERSRFYALMLAHSFTATHKRGTNKEAMFSMHELHALVPNGRHPFIRLALRLQGSVLWDSNLRY